MVVEVGGEHDGAIAELRERRLEVLFTDNDPTVGVIGDVGDLGRRESHVHRDDDGIELEGGHRHLAPFRSIGHQQPDTVAGADSQRSQAHCEFIGSTVDLTPREVTPFEAQADVVRAVGRPVTADIGEMHVVSLGALGWSRSASFGGTPDVTFHAMATTARIGISLLSGDDGIAPERTRTSGRGTRIRIVVAAGAQPHSDIAGHAVAGLVVG